MPVASSALALIVWAISLPFVDVNAIDGWGLLSGLPLGWGFAFLLALATLVATLFGGPGRSDRRTRFARIISSSWALPFLVLTIILFTTTSVAYGVPRYPWTYKHIGVTEYLLVHGTPDRDLDIYQNFPGFFYLTGFVHRVLGLPVMLMARWSEIVAVLINACAVYWAIGALTRNRRLRAVTTVLFTLANWIGQTYFAPQALAFPAGLIVLGAFLRMVAHGHGRPAEGKLVNKLSRPARRPADPTHRPFWAGSLGVVVCIIVFAVIVVSHQFTPVAILIQVALLTVVLRLRRPWLVIVLIVVEALWVAHSYPFLSEHFALLQKLDFENIRPPAALAPTLAGAGVMAQVPHVITVLVAVATAAGVIRTLVRTRRLTSLVVPATLALAPLIFVAVQPYGQEGVLRAYMFGLPWCTFLIARDLLGVDQLGSRPGRRAVAAATLTAVLGVLAVPATLGNEMIAHVSPADVAADHWYEKNAPKGSELFEIVPAYPGRSTSEYDQHVQLQDPLTPGTLREVRGFETAARSSEGLLEFTRAFARKESAQHDIYLAVGPTQREYLRLYGLASGPVYADYITGLKRDPTFTLVYDKGGSYLFRVH